MAKESTRARRPSRVRMTSAERREQLIEVSRELFAARGYEGTSVEEIAAKAQVSKPIVYEHFGGKEGLYAVVVDREVNTLLDGILSSLTAESLADANPDHRQRELIERAALALLDYIENNTDGFRILSRDSSVGQSTGSFASLLSDIASQVEGILVAEFRSRGLDAKNAPMYAQMLVGMVALTGQWWLDTRRPKKSEVAAHVVNLAWNGLSKLEPKPRLLTRR
jgi:AcrR family transcriptional regulator